MHSDSPLFLLFLFFAVIFAFCFAVFLPCFFDVFLFLVPLLAALAAAQSSHTCTSEDKSIGKSM